MSRIRQKGRHAQDAEPSADSVGRSNRPQNQEIILEKAVGLSVSVELSGEHGGREHEFRECAGENCA